MCIHHRRGHSSENCVANLSRILLAKVVLLVNCSRTNRQTNTGKYTCAVFSCWFITLRGHENNNSNNNSSSVQNERWTKDAVKARGTKRIEIQRPSTAVERHNTMVARIFFYFLHLHTRLGLDTKRMCVFRHTHTHRGRKPLRRCSNRLDKSETDSLL